MILSSDEIRSKIKNVFDKKKSIFDEKLYKTKAIKDKTFFCPNPSDLIKDFGVIKAQIAQEFGIRENEVKYLNKYGEIFDCDNMAELLKCKLNVLHYQRLRDGEHNEQYQYAVLQVTELKKEALGTLVHDFCMVFTNKGIYFADLMRDTVWPIDDYKPNLIGIG